VRPYTETSDRWRQYAPHPIHASLGIPSPQPKRHLDRFSHFCTAHGRASLYFIIGRLLTHGGPGPHLIHDSLGVSEPTTQTASRLNQPFLHSSAQGVRILYNGPPLGPSKLPLPMGDLDPSSKTRFFGPTRVLNSNGISIGSAVFAELITVTDREITLYSVCHNLYVGLRSTAMRLDFVRCHRSTVANIVTPGQKCLQAGDRESLGRNSPKQEMPKGK